MRNRPVLTSNATAVAQTPNPNANVLTIAKTKCKLFKRYSSYRQFKRIVAYVFRFRFNSSRKERRSGELSVDELRRSEFCFMQTIQEDYQRELQGLKKSNYTIGDLAL